MCQAHASHRGKYPRWSLLRPKIEMSESKIKNAKIENGAKHSPFSFASKILGDPKGCSRASNIWCIFVSSMLNLKIILQTIFDNFQIHFSYDNLLSFYRFDFENANENLKEPDRNVENKKITFFDISKFMKFD